jgi:hypothetical protein
MTAQSSSSLGLDRWSRVRFPGRRNTRVRRISRGFLSLNKESLWTGDLTLSGLRLVARLPPQPLLLSSTSH